MTISTSKACRRVLLIFPVLLFFLFYGSSRIYASSVYVSDSNPDIGDSFSVTISYGSSNIGSAEGALKYNPSILQYNGSSAITGGGNGEVSFSQVSTNGFSGVTFSFTVIGPGSGTVTATTSALADINMNELSSSSGSASFTASKHATGGSGSSGGGSSSSGSTSGLSSGTSAEDKPAPSSDARLASLTVASGSLSPAFSPDVYSYTLHVAKDVKDFTISALPSSSKASVDVSGSSEVTEDEVTRVVTVTAEDGTQIAYSITLIRDGKTEEKEKPVTSVKIGDAEYTFVATPDKKQAPGGFKKATAKYGKRTVNVLKSKDDKLILVQMQANEGGNLSWFLFDEKKQSFTPVNFVEVKGKKYLVLAEGLQTVYGDDGKKTGAFLYNPATGKMDFLSAAEDKKSGPNTERALIALFSGIGAAFLTSLFLRILMRRKTHRKKHQ